MHITLTLTMSYMYIIFTLTTSYVHNLALTTSYADNFVPNDDLCT
jgi:hypothetical protein